MAQDLKYMLSVNVGGRKKFTMPQGFLPQVEIHCWGAGGGSSSDGSPGGGGGYAKTIVNINSGDLVKLQVGLPGQNSNYTSAAAGGTQSGYVGYRGGSGAAARDEDNDTGAGGGGGGASAVEINGVPVCVAAGGGGGGGKADDGPNGTVPGLPGGVYRALTNSTDGGSSASGYSTGGGGGGGYLGGAAGASYGDDAGPGGPGSGGQNFGNTMVSGSGTTGAGKLTPYFPTNFSKMGDAGYSGYIVMVFYSTGGVKIKNPNGSGQWVEVDNSYVKVPTRTVYTTGTPVNKTVSLIELGTTTWIVPEFVYSITITIVGGGGGGGYSNRNSRVNAHQHSGGGGGSGGVRIITLAVSPGQTLTATVGRGGTGALQNPRVTQNSNQDSPLLSTELTATSGETSSVFINGITFTATGGGAGGNADWTAGTAGTAGAAGSPGGVAGQSGVVVPNGSQDPRGGGLGYATGGLGGVGAYGSYGGGGNGASVGQVSNNSSQAAYGGLNGRHGIVSITYTTSPPLVPVITGGWKTIETIYTKVNGAWKKLAAEGKIIVSDE